MDRQNLLKHNTIAKKAIWKDKRKSLLVQDALKVQRKKSSWILDSGCTSHMTGDNTKLNNLNNFNGGSVKFGNNGDAKIMRKGYVSLNGGKILCNKVLYVDGLKHNLLSVSQLCKDSHNVIFSEKGCVIRNIETGKEIGKEKRTSNNLYILMNRTVMNAC